MSNIEKFSLRETPSHTRRVPVNLDYSNLNKAPRFSGFLYHGENILASVSDLSGTGEYEISWWDRKYNPRHVADAGLSPKELIDLLVMQELDIPTLWQAIAEKEIREVAEARARFEKLI